MKVTVFKKSAEARRNKPWCCRWEEYGTKGERRRKEKHFALKSEADDFADERRRAEAKGQRDFSAAELRDVNYVFALCAENDLQLVDVVLAGLDALCETEGGEARKVPTIEWAIEGFYEEGKKRNLRPASLNNRRVVLEPFKVGRADRLISSLTTAEMLDYILEKYSNEGSRTSLVGIMKAFYNWCSEKGREWVPVMAPKALTWTASMADKRRPMVYSAVEAAALLSVVSDKLKPAVAIALFAGVRPEELRRMEWSWTDARGDWFGIDLKRRKIELSGEWTKTRQPRTLHDLPENLWLWLERFSAAGLLIPITQRNWYRNINEAKKDAKIRKAGSDIMRHSFGSHGRHRGIDWVIDTLGHTEGMKVFNEHYNNNAIGPEDAEKYFSIAP